MFRLCLGHYQVIVGKKIYKRIFKERETIGKKYVKSMKAIRKGGALKAIEACMQKVKSVKKGGVKKQ